MKYDLLTTVEFGGCSAKLSATQLSEALKDLPKSHHENLLVDIETHDDAGVYKINDSTAIIQTVDFFPPVCSDPFEFGQIAAANALSDVYAMGGTALTAMNIVMFPSSKIPMEVLAEILKGGQSKVDESGAVLVGGHTIDDFPPKYGLSVTGTVHPLRIITNRAASPGDLLVLTKPIGTGILAAGKKTNLTTDACYRESLESMKQLNKEGARLMQLYDVKCATDITGFSLLGHALKMARASHVTFRIDSKSIPLFKSVFELANAGCLPGACFRNQEFAEKSCLFSADILYARKMILYDAQTSGGLLIAVPKEQAKLLEKDLKNSGYPHTATIGEVVPEMAQPLHIS